MMKPRNKVLVVSLEGNLELFDTTSFSAVQSQLMLDGRECRDCSWHVYTNTFAIADQHSIRGYDARNNRFCYTIPFNDYRNIRSVSTDDGYKVTFTTGSGCLVFGDVRTQKVLPIISDQQSQQSQRHAINSSPNVNGIISRPRYYEWIGGHVVPGAFYRETFFPHPVEQGIFTHSYDPSGLRLFIGGGPTLSEIEGSNASILH